VYGIAATTITPRIAAVRAKPIQSSNSQIATAAAAMPNAQSAMIALRYSPRRRGAQASHVGTSTRRPVAMP
jgi:hypothetical protein